MAVKFDTPDFTKAFETFFKAVPKDASAFEGAFKSTSEFASKYSDIVIGAAQKNVDLSAAWTKATLNSFDKMAKPQDEVGAYAKVASDTYTDMMQTAPERIADYAEIAKQAQLDTIELFMAAGKKSATTATKAAAKVPAKAEAAAKTA
ncbi:phasin, PhaP [Kordiimonas pumila]|uniref:Phasin, PhaP n=1 Tax=Kordiimonas pumila TaxID=2161677 RepID=A0ABV7D7N3_9PROT|nr:phasin, PhaP [Kordiimonas pumila]